MSTQAVQKHFEHFGLTCKEPEPLQNGTKVLGLHVSGNGERLCWRRGGDTLEVPPVITCWSTFSVCGKLVSHFPICGWLRVALVAIKQHATSVSSGWDNEVGDATLRNMLTETVTNVPQDDPVRGDWCVNGNEFTVWVDASSLAMGVAIEANIAIVEDACWLRLENDARHIYLAGLDANLKGVKLALQWQTRVLHIIIDSVYMHR